MQNISDERMKRLLRLTGRLFSSSYNRALWLVAPTHHQINNNNKRTDDEES